MHANQGQGDFQSSRSHLAARNHFADAGVAADAARNSDHFDRHKLVVPGSRGSGPEGIDQEWSYAESYMDHTHQAGLGKMGSIEEGEEDSAAVDPVLNIHRNLGLEVERYKKELDDHHKLGC